MKRDESNGCRNPRSRLELQIPDCRLKKRSFQSAICNLKSAIAGALPLAPSSHGKPKLQCQLSRFFGLFFDCFSRAHTDETRAVRHG
jgi:hypothetical protein